MDSLFLPFISRKRCTAGTRDSEFSTSRKWASLATWDYEWATSRQLSAACYERRAWLLAEWRYTSFYRSTERLISSREDLVEQQMKDDDETSAVQLHALLLLNRPWSFSWWLVLDHFIQRRIILRSFYSVMNHSRTVCPFCLNGERFCAME